MDAPFRLEPLPRPEPFTSDRRTNRSVCPAIALELALDRAARRAELDVVLIVDDEGMLVSQSPTPHDLTMLAAVTPIVGRGKAVPRVFRGGERRDMTVRPMELHGDILYVAAIGGSMAKRIREVKASVAAAKRILA